MKPAEEKQRFALRKLSIGTVSVLVGFLAFGFSASDQVKAATDPVDAAQTTQVQNAEQPATSQASSEASQSSDATQPSQLADQLAASQVKATSTEQPVNAAAKNKQPIIIIPPAPTEITDTVPSTTVTVITPKPLVTEPQSSAAQPQSSAAQPTVTTPQSSNSTNPTSQATNNSQPVVAPDKKGGQSVTPSAVYETKKITRVIDDIFFDNKDDGTYVDSTYETVYTANYQREKITHEDGSVTYTPWQAAGGQKQVFRVPRNSPNVLISTEYLGVNPDGRYSFEQYTPRGVPASEEGTKWAPIMNYSKGPKSADGRFHTMVDNVPVLHPIAGFEVDPDKTPDSLVEVEYLGGFDLYSTWQYKRNIDDFVPQSDGSVKDIKTTQDTGFMSTHFDEDPRADGTLSKVIFKGGEVPAYTVAEIPGYTPHIKIQLADTRWVDASSIPARKFSNFERDVYDNIQNFRGDEDATQTWTENVRITYTKNTPIPVHDSKPVTETIRYIYSDGTTALNDFQQTVNLTRDGNKDPNTNVTTWGDWSTKTINAVTSPTIKGYAPDKPEIAAQNVTVNSNDLFFTVTYTKNPPKSVTDTKAITETIHYVYTDGSQAKPDVVKTANIARQGQQDAATDKTTWGVWSTDTIDAVTSPTIKGYTPDIATVAAYNVDSNSKDKTITVIYTKNEPKNVTDTKAITETIHYKYTDGNQAAKDFEQTVNLTRQGKQDAATGEITWGNWNTGTIDAVTSPSIKGYTPDIATVGTFNVDGNSKDRVITVVYKKNDPTKVNDTKKVTETIHYQYTDGTQAAEDFQQTVNLTRQGEKDAATDEIAWGDWSTTTIPAVVSPTIKGYTPNIANVDAFAIDGNSKDKVVTVVYKKNDPKKVSDTKKVTETIHYVYSDGTKASNDFVKTVTLKRTGEQDPVTDEITWGNWDTDTIPEVPSPVINGYTPDKASVDAVNVSGTTPAEIDVTVTYTKNNTPTQPTGPQPTEPNNPTQPTQPNPTQPTEPNNPTQPTQPNPTQPTEPNNPTQPTQPKGQTSETPKQPDQPTEPTQPTQPKGENNEPTPVVPQNPDNPVTPATPATPTKPAQPVAENDQLEPQQPKPQANKLPQTGNDSNTMSIVGIAIASALAMLGISDKRQHD